MRPTPDRRAREELAGLAKHEAVAPGEVNAAELERAKRNAGEAFERLLVLNVTRARQVAIAGTERELARAARRTGNGREEVLARLEEARRARELVTRLDAAVERWVETGDPAHLSEGSAR